MLFCEAPLPNHISLIDFWKMNKLLHCHKPENTSRICMKQIKLWITFYGSSKRLVDAMMSKHLNESFTVDILVKRKICTDHSPLHSTFSDFLRVYSVHLVGWLTSTSSTLQANYRHFAHTKTGQKQEKHRRALFVGTSTFQGTLHPGSNRQEASIKNEKLRNVCIFCFIHLSNLCRKNCL